MRTPSRAAAALAAITLLSAGPVRPLVQDPGQDPVRRAPTDKLVFEAGTYDLADIIDRTARFLGRNYLYNLQEFQGLPGITLQNKLTADAAGCEAVVSQLLYTRGLAIKAINVEHGIYDVIAMHGPRRGELQTSGQLVSPADAIRMAGSKECITTTIELENMRAVEVAQTLRPYFATGSGGSLTVGTVGNGGAVIVSGFADQVANAVRMIQRADGAAKDAIAEPLEDRLQNIERRLARLEQVAAAAGK